MVSHHIKALEERDMSRLKMLEGKTGKCLVAFEADPRLADVSQAELEEIQAAEKEMKAVLVAYACPVEEL